MKTYFDKTYKNKHELIIGNSTYTVDKYHNKNPNKKFDVIFIDGGHDYITALTDIINCKKFARPDTILVVDDNPGISTVEDACKKAVEEDIIKLTGTIKDGYTGLVYGKYIFL